MQAAKFRTRNILASSGIVVRVRAAARRHFITNPAALSCIRSRRQNRMSPKEHPMIARIEIHRSDDIYEYRVLAEGEVLFDYTGFTSVVHCLAGAVEGLPPEVRAVEVACGGIVSGTYPLQALAGSAAQVAQHAVNTTAAVFEALQG
jgi:hypothetical protein